MGPGLRPVERQGARLSAGQGDLDKSTCFGGWRAFAQNKQEGQRVQAVASSMRLARLKVPKSLKRMPFSRISG
ncbi:MAG: hypothetical protein K0R03_2241 [Moraxellaceae bacterium]|nr:hypothetical protein [Moraxellaceae bacterium]